MAIDANTGLPGSGKTLSAVAYRLIPAMEAGRVIVTNIPLKLDVISKRYPKAKIHSIDLGQYKPQLNDDERRSLRDDIPPGALVALDELWQLWPAGLKTHTIPEDHKAFLAEHRHRVGEDGRSTDILLITQDLGQVAAFVRQLVDKTAITTKLDALGMKSRARVDMYQGAVTGHLGPKTRHIRSFTIRYNKKHFDLYQSHTQSQTGEAGDETRDDKRMTIWRSPLFIALALCFVFVVPWAVGTTKTAISPDAWEGEPTPAPATPVTFNYQPSPEAMGPPEPTPEPGPRQSTTWRLAGTIERPDTGEGFAMLQSAGGYLRLSLDACSTIPNSPDMQCMHDGKLVHVATGYGYLSGTTVNGAQGR